METALILRRGISDDKRTELLNTLGIGLTAAIKDNAPALEVAEWIMSVFAPYLRTTEPVSVCPEPWCPLKGNETKAEQPDDCRDAFEKMCINRGIQIDSDWARWAYQGWEPCWQLRHSERESIEQRGTMFGSACPQGKVMLEFVSVGEENRQVYGDSGKQSPYSYYPVDSFFLEVYVDGKRFRIDVGNLREYGGGDNSRGIHINYPMDAEIKGKSLNAHNIVLATTEIEGGQP